MSLLDIIFPRRCVGCGTFGKYVCSWCRSTIQTYAVNEAVCPACGRPALDGKTHPRCVTRYGLDGLTSFFRYQGIVRKAVKALKYRFISDLAEEFVSLVPQTALEAIWFRGGVFVPIPLHQLRYRDRGYNQAELLGRHIASRVGLPMHALLIRVRRTIPQVEMKDRHERLDNMSGAFVAVKSIPMPECVILIDDVFTTGATMREAANVLKRSGAKKVWAVTMAR